MKDTSSLAVVQAQLDAFNAKDVEALMRTYAPNAEQFVLHGERLAKGHEELRPRYMARFEEPDLFVVSDGRNLYPRLLGQRADQGQGRSDHNDGSQNDYDEGC